MKIFVANLNRFICGSLKSLLYRKPKEVLNGPVVIEANKSATVQFLAESVQRFSSHQYLEQFV